MLTKKEIIFLCFDLELSDSAAIQKKKKKGELLLNFIYKYIFTLKEINYVESKKQFFSHGK